MSAEKVSIEPPLDDIMLSMDVVDTLRRNERIIERELDGETRRKRLIEKLREIYHGQGIDVPDHILSEGVKALEESRFTYEPPRDSFQLKLARLYVTRWHWGKWAGGILAGLFALLVGWQLLFIWPQARQAERLKTELSQTLPHQLETLYTAISTETSEAAILEQARQLEQSGLASAKAKDAPAARKAQAELTALLDELRLVYEVRIISRPGEMSGLWRIPRINPKGRNYYLVVEALNRNGEAIERSILNEENGKRESVTKWAIRVPQSVFNQISDDKRDDGIIQNAVIGEKLRGKMDVIWRIRTHGGALTKW